MRSGYFLVLRSKECLGYNTNSHLSCCGTAEGGAGVIPDFGQGGRDVFVLNVPHCECLGRPSAPFGLGWISQGGEEMGQSSTHILRQFHAGFLQNANAFFSFLGTASDPGVGFAQDLHRPLCPCRTGQEAAPGARAAAFCPPAERDPPHLGTGVPFLPQPPECRAHPEGQNPKEVIKGTGSRHQPPR